VSELEPVSLRFGELEPWPNGSKYPIVDETGEEVGMALGDDLAGIWSGTLYCDTTIGFWSFRRDQVLSMCALWLAAVKAEKA
jgi:hypothetical protein